MKLIRWLIENKTGDKIIVRGINKNENAKDAIVKIAGIVGVELGTNDIVFATQSTAENKTSTITAKFSSQPKKMNFWKQQKRNACQRRCMGMMVTVNQFMLTNSSPNTHTHCSHKQSNWRKLESSMYGCRTAMFYTDKPHSQTKRIHSSSRISDIEKAIMLSKKKATNKPSKQASTSQQRQNNGRKAGSSNNRKAKQETNANEDDDDDD